MSSPDRIVLELDSGVAPIAGRVCVERRPPRPFCGWTDLFGALRELADPLVTDGPVTSSTRQED